MVRDFDECNCFMSERTVLAGVQTQVRKLVRAHPGVRDAMQAALDRFGALEDSYRCTVQEVGDRQRQLARDLLARGLLFDPRARGSDCLVEKVQGLFPTDLVDHFMRKDQLPVDLGRQMAKAALTALHRDEVMRASDYSAWKAMAAEDRTAIEAGTHQDFSLRVIIRCPDDWPDPLNPRSLGNEDLERWSEDDYRSIVLYRLGGLADAGALRPIVPKPARTGDVARDAGAYAKWNGRLPVDQNGDLCPDTLPPKTAMEFLDTLDLSTNDQLGVINHRGHAESADLAQIHHTEDARTEMIQLRDNQVAILEWLGAPSRRDRVWKRSAVMPDFPAPANQKAIAKILNELHKLGLIDCPPRTGAKITEDGLSWLQRVGDQSLTDN